MNLEYKIYGSGDPIVFLHAYPLSGEMWDLQAEYFADSRYSVVIPDLRGFGESKNFSDILTMEDMAADVIDLTERLNLADAIFCGLSMGGYVLCQIAAIAPNKIRAMIFCDTNSAADTDEKINARFELIEKIDKYGTEVLIEAMLPKLVSEDTKANNPLLIEKLQRMFREVEPDSAIAALRGMATRPDSDNVLQSTSIPTAFITGANDETTPPAMARRMHSMVSRSHLFEIEKAGHYSNLEQPDLFNRAVETFLQTL